MQQSIGPYKIQGEIGRGGMGVVYRATDSRLDREVAIKALPEELAGDPVRLERFEREARTLAQVSHPNIAGIHGVEEQGGKRYLVLEFVDGETLADKIDRGPVELDEAVELACQIAAGVGAAHDAGVIHRDLKPANIKITPEGVIKVLDFGLARHEESRSSSGGGGSPAHEASITSPIEHAPTSPGVVLGTAAYMSPEQARGRRVDKRTDIWSFGVILYEMLTGASPFVGETASDSIGAVLHKNLDLSRVPTSIRHILERCLDRDRDKRFRDIGDVRIELESALKQSGTESKRPGMLTVALVAFLAAAAAGAGGLAIGRLSKPADPARHVRLSVAAPPLHNLFGPLLNPDGSGVLFAAALTDGTKPAEGYYRRFDDLEPTQLLSISGAQAARFSPSGAWVSFMAPISQGSSELRLVKQSVGKDLPPVRIASLPDSVVISGYNYLWLTEDRLVFSDARTNQIRFVNANDGTVSEPVKIDLDGYQGSYDVLVSRVDDTRALCSLFRYTAQGYQQDIALLDTKTAKAQVILENSSVAYVGPDGSLLFTRGSTLYGATLDLERRKVGPPVQLVSGLRSPGSYIDAPFQISRDGTLMFLPGGEQGVKRRLQFRLPDGTNQTLPIEPHAFEEAVVVSRDETRVLAVVASPNKLYEIWGTELESPRLRRVRGVPTSDLVYPQFAGDNDTFVYMRSEGGKIGVEAASYDGHFEPYWVTEPGDGVLAPQSVHPTKGTVLCLWERPEGRRLYKVDLKKGSQLTPVFSDSSNKQSGDYSPDGTMLAYDSDETGRLEIYVCTVREDGSLGRPVAVTTTGAGGMRWSRSPDALKPENKDKPQTLIVFANGGPSAYPITPGERPRIGKPEPLGYDFSNRLGIAEQLSNNRRLVIVRGENETPPTHAEVILNWYDTASRMIHGK